MTVSAKYKFVPALVAINLNVFINSTVCLALYVE